MFTPVSKEVAQSKFASTSICYTPLSKEVIPFKIETTQFKEIIIVSYAKSWCLHFYAIWKFKKVNHDKLFSDFLQIEVKGIP